MRASNGKRPINSDLGRIVLGLLGRNLLDPGKLIRDASIETLPLQDTQFNLSQYVPDQYLGKTANITLNNSTQNPTKIATCLNDRVFELAGYPAPRCNLADVTING